VLRFFPDQQRLRVVVEVSFFFVFREDEAVDFAVKRMLFVGGEHLFVPLHRAGEQSRFLKPVQFDADGVGALPKLLLQPTQIAPAPRIQEEPEEQLQPCFIADKGIYNIGRGWVCFCSFFVG